MINPYQAPTDPSAADGSDDKSFAEFHLTGAQIRYAESKFLLHRCGGRLTYASIAMIFLAVWVAFVDFNVPYSTKAGSIYAIPLFLREIGVMGLAAFVYLMLIRGVRRSIAEQLAVHGIVDGAGVMVEISEGSIRWEGTGGTLVIPGEQVRLIRSRRGLILIVDKDLFLFVPKLAAFSTDGYRGFVRELQRMIVSIAAG